MHNQANASFHNAEKKPILDISDIRNTALVMKDGVLYRPEELYSALGVAP